MNFFLSKAAMAALLVLTSHATAATYAYKVDQTIRLNLLSTSTVVDEIPQLGIIITSSELAPQAGVRSLGKVGEVQLIQPLETRAQKLWSLKAIHAADAWQTTKGEGVIVAVSDTGVDSDHPELAENMWRNPGEVAGNGIDDDGNGYVDDVHGWNFVTKKAAKYDNHYHGTHVAGTIAARIGDRIAGVAPRAKLMDVSFLSSSGSGTEANGAKTIVYAVDNGAKIINCSWGGPDKSAVLEEAIRYAHNKGVLVVAAAGNNGENIDKKFFSPASIDSENIISVAATASASGRRADYSNYGAKSVDLAAPGSGVISAFPSSGNSSSYKTLNGTSMAAPHVSGAAALIVSKYPHLNAVEIKQRLMTKSTSLPSWKKASVSSGMLNAKKALE